MDLRLVLLECGAYWQRPQAQQPEQSRAEQSRAEREREREREKETMRDTTRSNWNLISLKLFKNAFVWRKQNGPVAQHNTVKKEKREDKKKQLHKSLNWGKYCDCWLPSAGKLGLSACVARLCERNKRPSRSMKTRAREERPEHFKAKLLYLQKGPNVEYFPTF